MKLRFDITHEPYKDVLIVEDLDVEVKDEDIRIDSGTFGNFYNGCFKYRSRCKKWLFHF